jgi:two-component system OmpR family sensor kinase
VSLRARLLSAAILVAFLALAVFGTVTYSVLQRQLYYPVERELQHAAGPITASLQESITFHLPVSLALQDAPGLYVGLYKGGRIATLSPAYAAGKPYNPVIPSQLANPGTDFVYFDTHARQANGPEFLVQVSTFGNGLYLLLAAPLTQVNGVLARLLAVELAVAALALAVAVLLGWWLVNVGLKPLRAIEAATTAISAGQLDERVPESSRHTEVGRLAHSFNLMLDRIQEAFTRRDATEARLRQFVADASHELRTPVAAVKAYAELFSRGARNRPEDLGRVISGIERESGRMGDLVDDLLLLARLDEGRPLEREPVELVKVALDAVEAARLVGPEWPVTVEARKPVEVLGDPARLRQVVDNLLANVRAHTPPGTRTRLSVEEQGDEVQVDVIDNGPGIPPDQQARVFERFFRAESSRTRATGGTGLGLAIVSALVGAHGGRVGADNNPEGGARFWFRLPRYQPGEDEPAQEE